MLARKKQTVPSVDVLRSQLVRVLLLPHQILVVLREHLDEVGLCERQEKKEDKALSKCR